MKNIIFELLTAECEYNDIVSCVQWCKHAKECVGEEMYQKLMEQHEIMHPAKKK